MTERPPLTVACPNCGATVTWNAEAKWRPFCSERCKMIDLGEWVDGNRAIPGREDGSAPTTDDSDD